MSYRYREREESPARGTQRERYSLKQRDSHRIRSDDDKKGLTSFEFGNSRRSNKNGTRKNKVELQNNYDDIEDELLEAPKTKSSEKSSDENLMSKSISNELKAKFLKAQMKNNKRVSTKELIEQQEEASGLSGNLQSVKADKDIEPESMTISEMLKEERSTKNSQYDSLLSSKIVKDKAYKDTLDYQYSNASNLANHVKSGKINIKDIESSQLLKYSKKLDECQLCIENELIDIISMGNTTFLAPAPEPEISPDSCVIVPINHYQNTLYCEKNEWDEIQNFMKSLARFYYSQKKGVIFYESSVNKHNHAVIFAVPLPLNLCSDAPGFFKESILSHTDDWSEEKSLINTLEKSKSVGSNAVKALIAKEAPYFHVWFTLDGGLGHIVENVNRWPKGDLFAREVIGGMLRMDPFTIRKQGAWKMNDSRLSRFRQKWHKFDWTREA